jgi:hypothetical protein
MNFLKQVRLFLSAKRRPSAGARRRSVRPTLEALEVRDTPSTMLTTSPQVVLRATARVAYPPNPCYPPNPTGSVPTMLPT